MKHPKNNLYPGTVTFINNKKDRKAANIDNIKGLKVTIEYSSKDAPQRGLTKKNQLGTIRNLIKASCENAI